VKPSTSRVRRQSQPIRTKNCPKNATRIECKH
jgi:hypothetical protein